MHNTIIIFVLGATICIHFFAAYVDMFSSIKKGKTYKYSLIFNKKRMFYFVIIMIQLELIMFYFVNNYWESRESDEITNVDISTKIENISNNLSDASAEILSIQQELESRIEYVETLKHEAEIAENVISLSEDQVNAIQAKLNQELATSNSKSLYQGIAISAFFFILGSIIPLIINYFRSKHKKGGEAENASTVIAKYSDEQISIALQLIETASNTKTVEK